MLSCGTPLVTERIPGVRSVGITWLIPAGTATDPDALEGLSTMWNELLMRGAGALDSRAQADAFDRVGMSRGAEAGTFYMRLSGMLLAEHLERGLSLLADMALRPRFDEASVEPARDLCLQAIDALADDPQERASLLLRARHNPSPINRSGLGTVDGLRAITRADLTDGWAARSRPGGSILALAGDVDHDRVGAMMERLLNGWTGRAEPVRWGDAPLRGTAHHEPDSSNQSQIVLCHDAPSDRHPDADLERVLLTVLSGGSSSRLFSEVREKRGLCYSVAASYASERDYGRMVAYVGTTPERAQQSLDVLWEQLRLFAGGTPGGGGGRVEPDEFARAMVGLRSRLVFSGESSATRASALATDLHRRGEARSLAEIAASLERVTLGALNAYAARRATGPVTLVTLGPGSLTSPF
ncbi:MAG: insulinase family protein [Phycisphaerae bacterium]|nr:insulinase family protein [Phycisphaerae bacterium]